MKRRRNSAQGKPLVHDMDSMLASVFLILGFDKSAFSQVGLSFGESFHEEEAASVGFSMRLLSSAGITSESPKR